MICWEFGVFSLTLGLLVGPLDFFLSAFFAPLVFLWNFALALVGMVLWGIGLGAQDCLLNALLTEIVSAQRRSTAFGVFDTGLGLPGFWAVQRNVISKALSS